MGFLLWACAHPAPPTNAAGIRAELWTHSSRAGSTEALTVSGALDTQLRQGLRDRGFVLPDGAPADHGCATFASCVNAASANDAQTLTVVVDLAPRFDAELGGRYRWSVQANLALVPSHRPEDALERSLTIPVYLTYDREREEAALDGASPALVQEVDRLVDDFLRANAP